MKARLSTGLRVVAWSASSLLLVGAAVGTASAATHHAKNTNKDTATGTTSDDNDGTGPAGGPGAPGKMLHGSMTIEKKDGTFETYDSQVGKVTAVSATSITVLSDDKFSATYVIDDSTHIVKNGAKSAAGAVATGDTVMVRGEDEDDAVTADVIFDGKPPAGAGRPGGPHGPGGHGGPPPGGEGGNGGEGDGS